MKAFLFVAALAFTTTAAFAQTSPSTTPQSGTGANVPNTNGTQGSTMGNSDNAPGAMNTDRMGSTSNRGTMRSNKRAMKSGSKMKTNSDGSMKTKM